MTDSGSFDPGDLMYGVDIQALHALVTSTCSAAGVAGPSYASSVFASGQACAAAHVNDLVAAYGRAWDASSNKPGAKQSGISAGGLIYGALFQNMWTQLGQMTFGDYAPDANTFVCNFDDVSVGADETGAGGGLSGSDLILAQGGAVPGAGGAPLGRLLSTGKNFGGTPALTNLTRSATWTIILKGRELTETAEGAFWRGNTSGNDDGYHRPYRMNSGCMSAVVDGSNFPSTASQLPSSGPLWVFMYADGVNRARMGFSTSKPASWSAIPAGQKAEHATSLGNLSGNPAATYDFLVNAFLNVGESNPAYQVDWTLEYLVISRNALIGA